MDVNTIIYSTVICKFTIKFFSSWPCTWGNSQKRLLPNPIEGESFIFYLNNDELSNARQTIQLCVNKSDIRLGLGDMVKYFILISHTLVIQKGVYSVGCQF